MPQIVDTESAREFMREALTKISEEEIEAIGAGLAEKSRRFQSLLAAESVEALSPDEMRRLLRSVFSTRRKAKAILEANPGNELPARVSDLVWGDGPIARRFDDFCEGFRGVAPSTRHDFASECLHFARPDAYWLWTRWMWDPENETGSLRLVTMDGYDLRGPTPGQTYLRVGEAVTFVAETARAAGLQRGPGLFATNVYLVLVYVVYMYTTLRLRMTQEFNQVVPAFPELARRILGIHRLEV